MVHLSTMYINRTVDLYSNFYHSQICSLCSIDLFHDKLIYGHAFCIPPSSYPRGLARAAPR